MAKKPDSFYFDNYVACADLAVQAAELLIKIFENFDPAQIHDMLEEMHAIEHLAATYLRNNEEWQDKVIYFGPMGCRTGFYLILAGDLSSRDVLPLIISTFEFIRDFKGDVPGASAKDCGNYLDMNLPMANYLADHYLENALYVADDKNLNYPA